MTLLERGNLLLMIPLISMVETLNIVSLIIRKLHNMESGVFLAKWVQGLVMVPLKTKYFFKNGYSKKK